MGRRELTTTFTMIVLIGILVLGAVWGWRSLFAAVPETDISAAEPTPSCSPAKIRPGDRIRSSQVRVSVFNGTARSGLAGETMDALSNRGFQPGEVGNAPSSLVVPRVEVWSTEEDDPRARLVARQFGKKLKVRVTAEDLGPGVDVIVGDRYKRLVKAPRRVRVQDPQQVCIPVQPSPSS